jgi:hypothetical protein
MRRRMQMLRRYPLVLVLLLTALAALVVSACGGDDDEAADGPDPASVAPASAPLYFEAAIKPEGETKENLDSTLSKLLNTDDPSAMIREQVVAGLEEEGVNYDEEIDPWLGSTMGGFLSDFSEDSGTGALAVAVTDADAALETMDKLAATSGSEVTEAEYEGTSYKVQDEGAFGIVEDFLIIGTEAGFQQAVDAAAGDSLADDSEASSALDSAADGALMEAFVDVQGVIDAALAGGAITQQDLNQPGVQEQLDMIGEGDVVMALAAGEDNMSFEVSGPAVEGTEASDIVSTLPSEAWLAFGAADVGTTIATTYQQFLEGFQQGFQESIDEFGSEFGGEFGSPVQEVPDLNQIIREATGLDLATDFEWVGDVGGFVQGTSLFEVGGGLVIETDDPQQAAATLAKLRQALSRERALKITPTEGGGFNITTPDVPAGAEIGIRDDKVVFAFAGATIDEVLEPSETLGDSDRFSTAQSALGEDISTSFFLDMATVISLAEGAGATTDPEYQQAAPFLSAIDYLVAGGGTVDDRSIGRFVLGVKEPSSSSSAAIVTP